MIKAARLQDTGTKFTVAEIDVLVPRPNAVLVRESVGQLDRQAVAEHVLLGNQRFPLDRLSESLDAVGKRNGSFINVVIVNN